MFGRILRHSILGFVSVIGVVLAGASARAVPVGLELLLMADVSGSVDAAEYELQKNGYADVFLDSAIQARIAAIPGGVAVAYMEWDQRQFMRVGWRHLTDAASSNAFAMAIRGLARLGGGFTAPGDALYWGRYKFLVNGFDGPRRVIDIAGDGIGNAGEDPYLAASAARAFGITVNGLAILGESGLETWYRDNIVTPGGGFLQVADGFGDFGRAIREKVMRELASASVSSGAPVTVAEPSPLALFALALIGLGIMRRRRAV